VPERLRHPNLRDTAPKDKRTLRAVTSLTGGQEGLGGLFVVVLLEPYTRLGKQHRGNQSGSYEHNRPKPIPPTRVLVICTHELEM
jgi:hypothetical protein